MTVHAANATEMEAELRLRKDSHQQPTAMMFDMPLARPCSSNSADSISASEAFSTAALESDTSEGQPEDAPRLPSMQMQVRDIAAMMDHMHAAAAQVAQSMCLICLVTCTAMS